MNIMTQFTLRRKIVLRFWIVRMMSILLALISCTTIVAADAKPSNQQDGVNIAGELKKWHTVTLTFDGPEVAETDENNPFLNYRLNVTFSHKTTGKTYKVPGYFAADGDRKSVV